MTETAVERLSALEADARRLWNERQEDCAQFGANFPMPTVSIRVDDLCALLARSSEGAEPAAWTSASALETLKRGMSGAMWPHPAPAFPIPLYLSTPSPSRIECPTCGGVGYRRSGPEGEDQTECGHCGGCGDLPAPSPVSVEEIEQLRWFVGQAYKSNHAPQAFWLKQLIARLAQEGAE